MINFGKEYISQEMLDAKELVFEIEEIYNKFPKDVKYNEKSNLAIGCINTSLSHYKTIILSISYGLFISALSLMRSQYEANIRGYWIFYCMNDRDIRKFDEYWKNTNEKQKRIRELENWLEEDGIYNKELYKQYNDFTHCGMELANIGFNIDYMNFNGFDNHLKNSNLIAKSSIKCLRAIISNNIKYKNIEGY